MGPRGQGRGNRGRGDEALNKRNEEFWEPGNT